MADAQEWMKTATDKATDLFGEEKSPRRSLISRAPSIVAFFGNHEFIFTFRDEVHLSDSMSVENAL
jgi:hypothetical protein